MIQLLEEITHLVKCLNEYTKAYDEGNPLISDKEWDDLYFRLKELEDKTGLILSNSPTQTINYEVVNELEKKTHDHKMLSLEKTKIAEDVIRFGHGEEMLAMCKMDGLTCSLTYEAGKLVSAETRGNGLVGENILHNVRVLPSIPKTIPYCEKLTIDGEIICTYKDFEEFQDLYAHPRNFASGSIRLLDSKECFHRKLTFVAWDVIGDFYDIDGNPINYLAEKLRNLRYMAFTVVPFIRTPPLLKVEHVEAFIKDIQWMAEECSYPIDGAVFKFNDCEYGRSLGETEHHFKNALAYKFYDDVFLTSLLDIEWTMGRTGTLTPVAIFTPINIDGTEVNRASLHNISIMGKTLHGKPFYGQKLEVYKANMIIPQISNSGTVNDMEDPRYIDYFTIPKICPVCGELTEQKSECSCTVLVCSNPNCPGKFINKLDHFCGKKGLDMKGISKATLEKLLDWGWIETYVDIFNLSEHKSDWVKKSGFGVRSVEKILSAIEEGKTCELHQFIASLGIPLIGTTASKDLANHFKTWDNFIKAVENKYAFYELPNFGAEMHSSISKFNYDEAKFIASHYINFVESETAETANSNLEGKVFVVTGKVNRFKNRDELKSKIEALGGKVTGSVSKNTHYLINNDVNSTSSKNNTAKSLNIPILSEDDFIEMFGI